MRGLGSHRLLASHLLRRLLLQVGRNRWHLRCLGRLRRLLSHLFDVTAQNGQLITLLVNLFHLFALSRLFFLRELNQILLSSNLTLIHITTTTTISLFSILSLPFTALPSLLGTANRGRLQVH